MTYLKWASQTVSDLSAENIERMYAHGYVFTRVERGMMNQTRSFRVDLRAYEPSSENRRILRKAESLSMAVESLPYAAYDWKVGKLAKDFYEKFGDNVFTANKIRELMTDAERSNFNRLFVFTEKASGQPVGYAIAYQGPRLIHYSYPFYVEDPREPSRGLGMMTLAIEWAKRQGADYLYLGSLSRPSDTYKLQFKGGEWFDGKEWRRDLEPLKEILK
ncbi:MAG TPA: GNAT family N-acetyltransferase [Candidatus Paceibacterota bacterium]|nr:GNAT family N-acetyltransferase [Candidatus Paceibacterota bacterium]